MTTAATTTLTAWLTAQLDADEAAARNATNGPWWYDPKKWNSVDHEESVFAGERGLSATTVASTGPGNDQQSMLDAAHIARHDPARVLAQVAAHRVIVELHEGWRPFGSLASSPPVCSTCAENYEVDHDGAPMVEWPCPTLRAVASIYADAPGFQEEWR